MKEFNKDMVATMERNGAKKVFINDKGEWLFHETKGFAEYSIDEVLGNEAPKESKPFEKMNLKELQSVIIEKGIEVENFESLKKADLLNILSDNA